MGAVAGSSTTRGLVNRRTAPPVTQPTVGSNAIGSHAAAAVEGTNTPASFFARPEPSSFVPPSEAPVFEPAPPLPPRAEPLRTMAGADLSDWEIEVGDGIWTADGEQAVTRADIETAHLGDRSRLQANVAERAIMAHNITFRRILDETALGFLHLASFEFRVPTLLDPANPSTGAQTFEGGFFIWDGGGTRREIGLAYQWVLNPWHRDFGWVQRWSHETQAWAKAGYLKPDTEWHTATFLLDPENQVAVACLDDYCVDNVYTELPKSADWGRETATRFQAEIISLDPGPKSKAPSHAAEVRDWSWEWSPSISA